MQMRDSSIKILVLFHFVQLNLSSSLSELGGKDAAIITHISPLMIEQHSIP